MKSFLLIVVSTAAVCVVGCSHLKETAFPISLVYRQYEPIRGGRILISGAPFPFEVKGYRNREYEIMSSVCAPEGYKIIDEGIQSAPGSLTSYNLPYGKTESVVGYATAEYRNFRCVGEPVPPPK